MFYILEWELLREIFLVGGWYLWGILGQWDILLLNLTSIGFTNFFRCLIFDLSFFTNADVVTIKDETSKENLWNWCRSYWLPLVSRIFNFTVLLMKISQRPKISFLVTTCNKKRHLEKFVKPKQYEWRMKISQRPKSLHRFVHEIVPRIHNFARKLQNILSFIMKVKGTLWMNNPYPMQLISDVMWVRSRFHL